MEVLLQRMHYVGAVVIIKLVCHFKIKLVLYNMLAGQRGRIRKWVWRRFAPNNDHRSGTHNLGTFQLISRTRLRQRQYKRTINQRSDLCLKEKRIYNKILPLLLQLNSTLVVRLLWSNCGEEKRTFEAFVRLIRTYQRRRRRE